MLERLSSSHGIQDQTAVGAPRDLLRIIIYSSISKMLCGCQVCGMVVIGRTGEDCLGLERLDEGQEGDEPLDGDDLHLGRGFELGLLLHTR